MTAIWSWNKILVFDNLFQQNCRNLLETQFELYKLKNNYKFSKSKIQYRLAIHQEHVAHNYVKYEVDIQLRLILFENYFLDEKKHYFVPFSADHQNWYCNYLP